MISGESIVLAAVTSVPEGSAIPRRPKWFCLLCNEYGNNEQPQPEP
jgi:hypothetical protein